MQLMIHVVVGYPTLRESERLVTALARAGSDIIELQIPCSDPVADGPVIAAANQVALENKVTARSCLTFAQKMSRKFPQVRFLIMSYLNPILRIGVESFCRSAQTAGVRGLIIPDLPIEEAGTLLTAAKKNRLDFIFVLAPNTATARIKKITAQATGLLYCVARLGVTGRRTDLTVDLQKFLTRVRRSTELPLAVGFGVEQPADIQTIQKAGGNIAVIGSAILRAHQKGGIKAAERLVRNLKKA